MLQSRDLDDQRYEEIVDYAVSRLPWLCPEWTNHNASDPGITIIELMAWYKEMQQYHMNSFTDDMKRRLLKLAGAEVRRERAAVCGVEPSAEDAGGHSALSRLETPEGIVFELEESIPQRRVKLAYCWSDMGGALSDVFDMLGRAGISIQPFRASDGKYGQLLLGFDRRAEGELRLWIDVDEGGGPPRNQFLTDDQTPRIIEWSFEGCGAAAVRYDETHALSRSGYIAFEAPENWAETSPGGAAPAYYLRAVLKDPGCEESVRLADITAGRFRASQRETWAKLHLLQVERLEKCRVLFNDALAENAAFTAFLRTEDGWTQLVGPEEISDGAGRGISFCSEAAVEDGEANLAVTAADPIHYHDLFFDSNGLPGMTLTLSLQGRQPITDSFTLICDTLCEDGSIRPQIWSCAEDFYACGPRDRVFTYDPLSESISFGDGRHGAIVPRGEAAVFISGLELSRCGEGNIPAGDSLRFEGGGAPVTNTAASGGAYGESVSAAAERFLSKLMHSDKCVTAEDYERTASRTPGLRVAAAKAIPGFDPIEPTARADRPVVTVVVIPYSQAPRPMPDERFLRAVQRHMDSHRPICNVVRVTAPQYSGIRVTAQLKARGEVSQREIDAQLADFLAVKPGGRSIGDKVTKSDVAMELQKIPGVMSVSRVELTPAGPDCYVTAGGDVRIPRNAVAFLQSTDIDIR